jgi:hypothetical protein
MASSHQDVPPCQWFSRLGAFLDRRSAARLAWLFLGEVLGRALRTPLEITLRDCKEIVGAGQQHVRFVWTNIGTFHICL